MGRILVSLVLSVILILPCARVASAQPAPAGASTTEPEAALDAKIAVWRFDALGIDGELVARLETLFRMELARLAKAPMPSRRDIDRAVTAAEQQCTGEAKCLAAIGKKLGVDIMVTGTVGSIGSTYVLDIKAIDVATAKTIKRNQTEPLTGSPDELIDNVRVAAYRLLAPDQLHGSLQVQTDLVGAEVRLDNKVLGKTPLANMGVVAKLPLGTHQLRVQASGYDPFEEDITINFQKVTQASVRLLASKETIGTGKFTRVERKPVYTRTWFVVGVISVAAIVGAVIGRKLGSVPCYTIVGDERVETGC